MADFHVCGQSRTQVDLALAPAAQQPAARSFAARCVSTWKIIGWSGGADGARGQESWLPTQSRVLKPGIRIF